VQGAPPQTTQRRCESAQDLSHEQEVRSKPCRRQSVTAPRPLALGSVLSHFPHEKKSTAFGTWKMRQKAFATALSAYESSCEPATSGQLLGSDKSVAFPPRKAHANPTEHGLDTPSHTRVYTCIYTHTCCGAEDGMQNMENPPREQRHAELTQRARSRFGGRLRAPEGLQCALRFALAMAKVTMHHTWHIYTLKRERRRKDA